MSKANYTHISSNKIFFSIPIILTAVIIPLFILIVPSFSLDQILSKHIAFIVLILVFSISQITFIFYFLIKSYFSIKKTDQESSDFFKVKKYIDDGNQMFISLCV
ncbi:hypothetical protein AB834_02805 [PVC group bacterium (ex Bugula neritina AB1)]|nr:hypothetical protein AB834_02805 [PVC group bacterium (ex Bugula neritina AB1)]